MGCASLGALFTQIRLKSVKNSPLIFMNRLFISSIMPWLMVADCFLCSDLVLPSLQHVVLDAVIQSSS